jgi:sentrin-specific protease 1
MDKEGAVRRFFPSGVISLILCDQFDLFSKDVILIPVNHNNAHWTGAAINFRRKRIESYDSMGMAKDEVFKVRCQTIRFFLQVLKKSPCNWNSIFEYI